MGSRMARCVVCLCACPQFWDQGARVNRLSFIPLLMGKRSPVESGSQPVAASQASGCSERRRRQYRPKGARKGTFKDTVRRLRIEGYDRAVADIFQILFDRADLFPATSFVPLAKATACGFWPHCAMFAFAVCPGPFDLRTCSQPVACVRGVAHVPSAGPGGGKPSEALKALDDLDFGQSSTTWQTLPPSYTAVVKIMGGTRTLQSIGRTCA